MSDVPALNKTLKEVLENMVIATIPDFENLHLWGHCCSWLDMNQDELKGIPLFREALKLRKLFWHNGKDSDRKKFNKQRKRLSAMLAERGEGK